MMTFNICAPNPEVGFEYYTFTSVENYEELNNFLLNIFNTTKIKKLLINKSEDFKHQELYYIKNNKVVHRPYKK